MIGWIPRSISGFFYQGELRMNPDDKKNNNSGNVISPIYPLMLVGAMVIGLILGVLKIIGFF